MLYTLGQVTLFAMVILGGTLINILKVFKSFKQ